MVSDWQVHPVKDLRPPFSTLLQQGLLREAAKAIRQPHRVIVHRGQASLQRRNAEPVEAKRFGKYSALSFIASKLAPTDYLTSGRRDSAHPPLYRSSRASLARTKKCRTCGSKAVRQILRFIVHREQARAYRSPNLWETRFGSSSASAVITSAKKNGTPPKAGCRSALLRTYLAVSAE
jgi:hypothetical protein